MTKDQDFEPMEEWRADRHTPGPWAVCRHPANHTWNKDGTIYSPYGRIGDAFGSQATGDWRKNADLMAAAPEMLAALKACREMVGHDDNIQMIDAVIAKAEGRAAPGNAS